MKPSLPDASLFSSGPFLLALPEVHPELKQPDASPGAREGFGAASLMDSGHPAGTLVTQVGIIAYRVKPGDTLSGIGAEFGISVQTIVSANPKVKAKALQVGQELEILPVSGIVYHVQEGETLQSIAPLFAVPQSQIKEYNPAVDFVNLAPGTALVVPGAKTLLGRNSAVDPLPNLVGYFIKPAQGMNWGQLHNYNAIDIANSCGMPIVAAAEGLVLQGASDGWNSGYGHFILIEHPNGTETRYAHLGDLSVSVGDYVRQNQEIGTIGNSGNVHGVPGCHLHFEVIGARNPFAK